jgi:hypothetical protein
VPLWTSHEARVAGNTASAWGACCSVRSATPMSRRLWRCRDGSGSGYTGLWLKDIGDGRGSAGYAVVYYSDWLLAGNRHCLTLG